MTKRKCFNCDKNAPPQSEHFILRDEVYCLECVEVKPYTAYQYFIDGEFIADSEDGDSTRHVEEFEDY
jgi:hypothetical protein